MKYFVGYKEGSRTVFSSDIEPTEETHGKLFKAVTGPFRTKRGALYMARSINCPYVLTVNDAETLSKGV